MSKAIDTWREPHGSSAGRMGNKDDHVEEVQRLMRELGADEEDRLQSLGRLTAGDLIRLSGFLEKLSAAANSRNDMRPLDVVMREAAARLREGLTPERARKFLQASGYLDESGEVAEPYRAALPSTK